MKEPQYTIAEAATYLGRSEATIRRYKRLGILPEPTTDEHGGAFANAGFSLGRKVTRYPKSVLDDLKARGLPKRGRKPSRAA